MTAALLLLGLTLGLFLGLLPHVAMALAFVLAVATVVTYDLWPIVNNLVLPLLTPILGAALLWLVYRVQAAFHLHVLDGKRAVLQAAITNGLAWASGKLDAKLSVHVDSHVAAVASYVTTTVPGTLKALGVDPAALGAKIGAEIVKAGDAADAAIAAPAK